MLKLVQDASAHAEQAPTTVGLDELCRLAAQEMLKMALLAERRAYLDAHADLVDKTGKRLVVGNGYAKERDVTTGAGLRDDEGRYCKRHKRCRGRTLGSRNDRDIHVRDHDRPRRAFRQKAFDKLHTSRLDHPYAAKTLLLGARDTNQGCWPSTLFL